MASYRQNDRNLSKNKFGIIARNGRYFIIYTTKRENRGAHAILRVHVKLKSSEISGNLCIPACTKADREILRETVTIKL